MTASTWFFTNNGRTNLLNGTFNLGSDNFNMALFTSGSNLGADSTLYTALTNEHPNINSYTIGGISMGPLSISGTIPSVSDSSVSWHASGGPIIARCCGLRKYS